MFFVVRRATLLIPSGPANDPNRKHLYICLADPLGAAREALLVPVASVHEGEPHDATCHLYPGDHRFIRHESYVNYRFARIEQAERIEKGVRDGVLVPHDVLDGAVFARVCKGLQESRLVAPKIRAFFAASEERGR
jgi:hypothetical protein